MTKKPDYPGTTEVVPGVFIDFSGDPAVYIADASGEIVTWNYDEVREDPGAWTASLMGVILAAKRGPDANREVLEKSGDPFKILGSREQPARKRKIWGDLTEFLVKNVRMGPHAYCRHVVSMGGVTVNGSTVHNPDFPLRVGDLVVQQQTTYTVPE